MLDGSGRKPNKMGGNNGSEFYNRSLISQLQDDDIEMYSTHNEAKPFVAERLVTFLKNKIYK